MAAARPAALEVGAGLMSLNEAVDRARPGQTIEIKSNGPFAVEAIRIQAKSLTIRGAPGTAPVIRFGPKARAAGSALCRVVSGHLDLQGLHFVADAGRKSVRRCFIESYGSTLTVRHCSFTIRGNFHRAGKSVAIRVAGARPVAGAHAPAGGQAHQVQIENCVFRNEYIALSVRGHKHRIVLQNSVCLGHGSLLGFDLSRDDPVEAVRLSIDRCTAVCGPWMVHITGQRPSATAIRITCNRSLLAGTRGDACMIYTWLAGSPPGQLAIPVFTWEGGSNLYQGFRWLWCEMEDGTETFRPRAESLAQWLRLFRRDRRSRQSRLPFRVRRDAPVDRLTLDALAELRLDDPSAPRCGAAAVNVADVPAGLLKRVSWGDLAP